MLGVVRALGRKDGGLCSFSFQSAHRERDAKEEKCDSKQDGESPLEQDEENQCCQGESEL